MSTYSYLPDVFLALAKVGALLAVGFAAGVVWTWR